MSIAANIAEGCGKDSHKEFARFLEIAAGSASESQCLLILTRDLMILPEDTAASLESEVAEI